jgi:hypothetical protein
MQRYEEQANVIKVTQGKRRYSTIYYPIIERKTTDLYILTKRSDRLDLLAHEHYGDPRYWIFIAKANRLHNGTIRVAPGTRLRIPLPFDPGEFSDIFADKQF